MFSTLSSYIWGEEAQDGSAPVPVVTTPGVKPVRDTSPDDWVLVGETSSPAPGNLAGALPPLPGDSTPVSQSSSSSQSEAGDVDMDVVAAVAPAAVVTSPRQRHSITQHQAPRKETLKHVKSAQLVKQKKSGKALTSKALNRANKTVYSAGNKKHQFKQNLNIKMAGANKNLKQC